MTQLAKAIHLEAMLVQAVKARAQSVMDQTTWALRPDFRANFLKSDWRVRNIAKHYR